MFDLLMRHAAWKTGNGLAGVFSTLELWQDAVNKSRKIKGLSG
jgi:hypothetical protein